MASQAEGQDGARGQGRSGVSWSWLSVILALVPAGILLVLLLRPVWDVDIFWQLKLGELILANAGPIHIEPFAALHLGEPLPTVAWMGQAIMASVRQLGGWGALRVVDAALWLGGFGIVAWACRRSGASQAGVALALLLAVIAALPTASIRPQSFACMCFGLLLAIQRLHLGTLRTIVLSAPLLVIWQNLHPSVTVGVLAMGVIALVQGTQWLGDRRQPFPLAPGVLAVVGLGAVFATPDGAGVITLSAVNAKASIAIGASEWLPFWIKGNWSNALNALISLGIALYLVFRHRERTDAAELAVMAVLFVMTANTYRFVLFWAVALVPVVARAASARDVRSIDGTERRMVVASLLAVAAITPLVWPTRFVETLPLAALQRLKAEGVRGTVYGDFPFGGAIIDTGYPAWRVAYDGRYYRYTNQEWRYNGGIENGIVPLVDVVRKWRPAAFVLNENHNTPIARELAGSPRWRCIWRRDGVVVYVPRR